MTTRAETSISTIDFKHQNLDTFLYTSTNNADEPIRFHPPSFSIFAWSERSVCDNVDVSIDLRVELLRSWRVKLPQKKLAPVQYSYSESLVNTVPSPVSPTGLELLLLQQSPIIEHDLVSTFLN